MAGDSHDHRPLSPTLSQQQPSKPSSELARAVAKVPYVWINPICGSVAGVASGVVTCPLDVIKTKLQAQGSFRRQQAARKTPSTDAVVYRGLIGTARTIVAQDGLKGLYRGLAPMLFGYIPTWAVYMGVYDTSKDYFAPHFSKSCLTPESLLTSANAPPTFTQDEKWQAHMAASVTAGACSTSATNPIWVIKTRLMSQVSVSAGEGRRTPWQYNNSFDAARQMYRSEGIRAFYSGLAPALLGLTHVAIQFPLYEYLKFRFTGLEMGEQTASTPQNNLGILAATFLSKIAATTATYPHEVLRTRLQTQQRGTASSDGMINKPRYQGVVMMCRTIVREEGWRAFYNGLGTNMLRAVPAAMTTMFTYETLKSQFIKMQKEAGIEHPRG